MATFLNCCLRYIRKLFTGKYQEQSNNGRGNNSKCGRRRSLVRRIGSALLPKPAPRICSGMALHENTESSVDSSHNGSLHKTKPDVVPSECKDLDLHDNDQCERITSLEQEIQHLKCLMDQILSQQKYTGMDGGGDNIKVPGLVSTPQPSLVPPPPPPPPPPMPVFTTSRSQEKQIIKKKPEIKDSKESKPIALGEIVKDLSKVKLRHVERTSTGSPVRQRLPQSDPSCILAAVLRRINSAVQID